MLKNLDEGKSKSEAITAVANFIYSMGFRIVEEDTSKPWGAYFRIDEKYIEKFVSEFFSGIKVEKKGKLTPKILLVAPEEKLSWQYHHRRAEMWKVLAGPVDVVQSETDELKKPTRKNVGDLVSHDKDIRHRLMGAGAWGVVAEIWQHTDPTNPSTEDDIVRLEDIYGR